MMRPGLGHLMNAGIGTEIVYAFVIILCSLMIYFGTKELYELTSHKGIKYFRQAFLFFALAYFFRSFIKFTIKYFDLRNIFEFTPRLFGPITLFLFVYLSSIAIFYLLYSVIYKKLKNNKYLVPALHLIALGFAFITLLSQNPLMHLYLNLFLFFLAGITVYFAKKNSKKKKGQNLYTIYLLLFVFWILNILDILIPAFIELFQIIIYLASISIFLTILYKVLRNLGIK